MSTFSDLHGKQNIANGFWVVVQLVNINPLSVKVLMNYQKWSKGDDAASETPTLNRLYVCTNGMRKSSMSTQLFFLPLCNYTMWYVIKAETRLEFEQIIEKKSLTSGCVQGMLIKTRNWTFSDKS